MSFSKLSRVVWEYYGSHGRELPWRMPALRPDRNGWLDPYKILVSELMLQQTQVSRVVPKYEQFMRELPTLAALSAAPLALVLELWSGLGYNRRAKYLHDAARRLVDMPLPWQAAELAALKGIGPNTAAAVCVYAFNQPHAFIETNIRSVFIHHFSGQLAVNDEQKVADHELIPKLEKALDQQNPREWYWALMDYGAYLKRTVPNPSRVSAHYSRQSTFAGSRRQLRGQLVRYLLASHSATRGQLATIFPDERLDNILDALVSEGLFVAKDATLHLNTSDIVLQ